ncbi:MAG: hypothetical protein ACODAB_03465 [Gemmatimonadota bacterium]
MRLSSKPRGQRRQSHALTPGALTGLVAILGCAPDESASAVADAWCEADSGAVVAFTAADDAGLRAEEGLGSPRFVELWRAGGLNEGEELAFPLNASVSPDGRLAIADFGLSELAVVDADGGWHGRWARPGQGPGELARPVAAMWSEDGTSVAVFDIENARIVFVEDGTSVRPDLALPVDVPSQVMASGSLAWAGATPDGHALLQPSPTIVADPTDPDLAPLRSAVLVAAPGSGAFDTLAARTTPALGESRLGSLSAPGWPRLNVAAGASGELAVGGEDARYRVGTVGPDGKAGRVICREAPPLPVGERETEPPADARDPYTDSLAAVLASAPRPDSLAPFGRLFLSHEGHLWVQRDRPSALRFGDAYHGVPGALYDVFDAEGRYLGEVRAPESARLQAALGDTVWAYEVGELDETWVVAYELRWTAE